jgi:hypothetical protein
MSNVISLHAQVAPIIIQNIPPAPTVASGLTQPVATVITAGVAFLVALVTGVGIWINHKQHVEKEQAAATERRHTEAVTALVEALEAGTKAWEMVGDAHNDCIGLTDGTQRPKREISDSLELCRTVETKLQLLALDDAGAMKELTQALQRIWDQINTYGDPADFGPALDARIKLVESFRGTINGLRGKYDPSAAKIPVVALQSP